MRVTEENLDGQYMQIYYKLYSQPKIKNKSMAKELCLARNTIIKRLKMATDKQIIVGPGLRKNGNLTYKEYVYTIKGEYPFDSSLWDILRNNKNNMYVARLLGNTDFFLISRQKIEFKKSGNIECTYLGETKKIEVKKVMTRTWEEALLNMQSKIMSEEVERENSQINCEMDFEWDEEFESLFNYFRDDLRKSWCKMRKEYLISSEKVYKFFNTLDKSCTIVTRFYPKGYKKYEKYILILNSEEGKKNLLKEVFCQLPTTSIILEVDNLLIVHAAIPYKYMNGSINSIIALLDEINRLGIAKINMYKILMESQFI